MSKKTYFCERLSTLVVVGEKLKKTSASSKQMYRCLIRNEKQENFDEIDLGSDELSNSINIVISKIDDISAQGDTFALFRVNLEDKLSV